MNYAETYRINANTATSTSNSTVSKLMIRQYYEIKIVTQVTRHDFKF